MKLRLILNNVNVQYFQILHVLDVAIAEKSRKFTQIHSDRRRQARLSRMDLNIAFRIPQQV
eukprot:144812-Amorphochlora_amoeboformis.AAC.1